MSIFLWVLQGLLALHTGVGAGWKLFNSEKGISSLNAIPHGVWMALIPFEMICAVGVVTPLLAPYAALGIAAEMLMFSGVHLRSGEKQNGPMFYWLGVAALCVFIAVGRFVIAPH